MRIAAKHQLASLLAAAVCLLAWSPASPASPRGAPEDDPERSEEVTVSFNGELTPLQVDESGGGELSSFGSVTLDQDCTVTGGTFSAAGLVLDDAVSLEGSTALTKATAEPTLFVNELVGSDVATVRAEPDGTVSGTGRITSGDAPGIAGTGGSSAGTSSTSTAGTSSFYRLRGTWTSSDILPPCIASAPPEPGPGTPAPDADEVVVPSQPRITNAVAGGVGSGAVTIAFESGDDWAPASAAPISPTAVVGVQYRVDTEAWRPIEAPVGRRGSFTVWDLRASGESRVEVRTVGINGFSEPSEAVSVAAATADTDQAALGLVGSDCAAVPLPDITVDSVEVSGSLEVTVDYSADAPEGFEDESLSECVASLEWSVAGNDVPDALRHQSLDPDATVPLSDAFSFSAFGLPRGEWTVTVDATSTGDPYAESTGDGSFTVPGGPPAAPMEIDCSASAPGAPSLTAPERNPDGSHTVGFALSAPDGGEAGACTTHVSAYVPSAGIAGAPVELDGAGGSFTVSADLEPGIHQVSIASVNAADERFPRAVGSALLAVPQPGSVENLALSYGVERFAFATGATVGLPPPAVVGAGDPAFAPLADLPVGLFLDPQTGALFGTAVRPTNGALSVPIQVTDSDGESATVELALEVADPTEGWDDAGYPDGLWLPAGEAVSVTPVSIPEVAGSFSSSDRATTVEPFSGTVLWQVPEPRSQPTTTTGDPAPGDDSTTGGEQPDAGHDGSDESPGTADTLVDTSIGFTSTSGSVGEDILTATAFAPATPVLFEADEDGVCASDGPIIYRSRRLQVGSSVGLLPHLPETAEPVRFDVTSGVLPPGVTIDAGSGQLMG
ncbi:MAG: putative Ig domain-containing protein, partial [Microthrixaceae bacterium]